MFGANPVFISNTLFVRMQRKASDLSERCVPSFTLFGTSVEYCIVATEAYFSLNMPLATPILSVLSVDYRNRRACGRSLDSQQDSYAGTGFLPCISIKKAQLCHDHSAFLDLSRLASGLRHVHRYECGCCGKGRVWRGQSSSPLSA